MKREYNIRICLTLTKNLELALKKNITIKQVKNRVTKSAAECHPQESTGWTEVRGMEAGSER